MLIEQFEKQVFLYTDKIAIQNQVRSVTYGRLNEYSNRIANRTRSAAGNIVPANGDFRIGLLLDDAVDMIAAVLGVLKAGFTYVPMVPEFPPQRIRYIARHAGIRLIITDKLNTGLISAALNQTEPGSAIDILTIETVGEPSGKESLAFHRDIYRNQDAYILYTSGSTGFPKGVRQTHRNIVHFARNYREILGVTPDDRLTLFSSFCHDASVMDVYGALLNGACLYPYNLKREDVFSQLPQWLAQEEITFFHSVPTVYRYFLSHLKRGDEIPALRYIVLGGEQVLATDIQRFTTLFRGHSCRLYNLYGQTESTYNSGKFFSPADTEKSEEISITLGEPVNGTEIVIVDDDGDELGTLEVGEIAVVSPHVSPGYWNFEGDMNDPFLVTEDDDGEEERIYFTGDLGRRLLNGEVEFLGRKDSQVKIRGFRVELGEIENALLEFPGIKTAAAKVVVSPSGESLIAAYFSADPGVHLAEDHFDTDTLRLYLAERLMDYMMPTYLIPLEQLPETVTGKIDRKALPDPAVSSNENYVPPETAIQKKIVNIWADVLELEEKNIGIQTKFSDLGGHSLKATVLTTRIHMELHVKVPLAVVFEKQTVQALAEYIENADETVYQRIHAVEKKEYYPMSSAQKRLFFHFQLAPEATSYNLSFMVDLGTDLVKESDTGSLQLAFQKLIRRHEILRTSFLLLGDQYVQRVHDDAPFNIEVYRAAPEEETDVVRGFRRPFDLSLAPAMRAGLIVIDGYYKFIVEMHHIVTDDLSLDIFEDEYLALLYGNRLPQVKLHYKDCSQWLSGDAHQAEIKGQARYWLDRFHGELPVLELPYDYPRPAVQNFAGKMAFFTIESQTTARLKKAAAEMGTTLYMMTQAAFALLLFRLSGQDDIVVGTPVAARRHVDLLGIMGMLVNMIPLRIPLTGVYEKNAADFLKEVTANTLEAFDNQEYPFEDLVDLLDVPRDLGRNPVFDVAVNYLDETNYQADSRIIDVHNQYEHRQGSSIFDLSLTVVDRASYLLYRLEYSTQLFKSDTIQRFITYFQRILDVFFQKPETPLFALDILGIEEKEQILEMSNGQSIPYDIAVPVHRLFREQALKTPDAVAAMGSTEGDASGLHAVTYRELDSRANRLAGCLKENGVTQDSIVGLIVGRSVDIPTGILAVLKAGGAYLPLDPAYPVERLRYMLADSNCRVILSGPEFDDIIDSMDNEIKTVDITASRFSESVYAINSGETSSDSLAYIIYTSGSTGRPKGIGIEHKGLGNLAASLIDGFGIHERDRIALFASISFDASVMMMWTAFCAGVPLYILDSHTVGDYRAFIDYIHRHGVSAVLLPPSYARNISISDLSPLRVLITGGAAASLDFVRQCMEEGDFKYFNAYGPTENTVCSSFWAPVPGSSFDRVTIGTPLYNTRMLILDRFLRLQPIGVPGEIHLAGPGIARGYLNRPELTNERFLTLDEPMDEHRLKMRTIAGGAASSNQDENLLEPDGLIDRSLLPDCPIAVGQIFYKSGDLGRLLPDGNFEFLGRTDQQVKIRGYRIELGEIEAALRGLEPVKDAVVVDRIMENRDHCLCAYVVTGHGIETEEYARHLSGFLPDYMIPAFFVRLEQIPLTPNGKVDRKRLPAPDIGKTEDYVAPKDEIEARLARAWAQVLEIEPGIIGSTSNFFHLGGHSLKANILTAVIHRDLQVKIPLSDVFKKPTLAAMAGYIRENTGAYGDYQIKYEIKKADEKDYYVLSFNQKRLYVLHLMAPDSPAFNITDFHVLEHNVNADDVKTVIRKILTRHDAFRTGFRMEDETPVQFLVPDVPVPLHVEDISNLETGEKQKRLQTVYDEITLTPFDLKKPPLLRAGIVKYSENLSQFIVCMHHIISDGWSMNLLKKDFILMYSALVQGKEVELEPLPVSYIDFAEWSNVRLQDPDVRGAAYKFWNPRLKNGFPRLQLPGDFMEQPGNRAAVFTGRFDDATKNGFKSFALDRGTTLFNVMFAAYILMLQRFAQQDEIVCSFISGGREHWALQPVIGFFVQAVPFKFRVTPDETAGDFLKRVHDDVLDILAYQDYPLELICEESGIRYPETAVSFNMLNTREEMLNMNLDSFTSAHGKDEKKEVKFDLEPFVMEYRNGIEINWMYRKDKFSPRTVEFMASEYARILDFIVRTPGEPVSAVRTKKKKKRTLKTIK